MMTSEETRVLVYLRQHGITSVAALSGSCLAGLPTDWVARIVANLDWLGYVTLYGDGPHAALQITEKGRAQCGGPHRARPRPIAPRQR
jgi:hypothetical protein